MNTRAFIVTIAMASILVLAGMRDPSIPAPGPGSVYDVSGFPGADASVQINACIARAIENGGGTCDARALQGTRMMSQQVTVGSAAAYAKHIGVALLLPETAVWKWHVTDGVSCGIYQFSSSSIVGEQPGGGGNRMVITASGGSRMDSLYCTAGEPMDGAFYVRAQGFAVENYEDGSTFANGVIHIRGIADQSSFTRIFGENYHGDVWHIDSACCGAKFDAVQGISNGGPGGGVPLTIGSNTANTHSISFYDSTFNEPGIGNANIVVRGGAHTLGINFYNAYMEGNGVHDPKTSMVYVAAGVGPIHFFGGTANTEERSMTDTKAVFENHGHELDLYSFEATNTTVGIRDASANVTVPVWSWSGNLGSIPFHSTRRPEGNR